jgi:hypothetical protein
MTKCHGNHTFAVAMFVVVAVFHPAAVTEGEATTAEAVNKVTAFPHRTSPSGLEKIH